MYSGGDRWNTLQLRFKILTVHKAFLKVFKQYLMEQKAQQKFIKDMRTISFILTLLYCGTQSLCSQYL